MAPEFASNVAHCDHIPVSLTRLRPGVKLSTRNRLHLLVGEVGEVDIVDAAWWAEQQRLRFFESPMKEDADRDYSWACSNCTFQNAAGIWQCEMCSHHKPGESCYCVLVLSKHAAACFVGDSHSLLFFVVDALAGAMVLRMTDSGPAAVPATSTAPLLPCVSSRWSRSASSSPMASSLVRAHVTASRNAGVHERFVTLHLLPTHAGYGNWHHTQPGPSEVAADA